eukprot:768741-Hanusia_phi.AAC.7
MSDHAPVLAFDLLAHKRSDRRKSEVLGDTVHALLSQLSHNLDAGDSLLVEPQRLHVLLKQALDLVFLGLQVQAQILEEDEVLDPRREHRLHPRPLPPPLSFHPLLLRPLVFLPRPEDADAVTEDASEVEDGGHGAGDLRLARRVLFHKDDEQVRHARLHLKERLPLLSPALRQLSVLDVEDRVDAFEQVASQNQPHVVRVGSLDERAEGEDGRREQAHVRVAQVSAQHCDEVHDLGQHVEAPQTHRLLVEHPLHPRASSFAHQPHKLQHLPDGRPPQVLFHRPPRLPQQDGTTELRVEGGEYRRVVRPAQEALAVEKKGRLATEEGVEAGERLLVALDVSEGDEHEALVEGGVERAPPELLEDEVEVRVPPAVLPGHETSESVDEQRRELADPGLVRVASSSRRVNCHTLDVQHRLDQKTRVLVKQRALLLEPLVQLRTLHLQPLQLVLPQKGHEPLTTARELQQRFGRQLLNPAQHHH